MKSKLCIILLSLLTVACSQVRPQKLGITEADITQAYEASLYAQFNQLYYTKFLYKAGQSKT
ncbi:hypothetical protein [Acinetobacter pittii]|uniref:hypothetical protein n=1 Tax=Acinetobacter pittii TaxID=48296 RepID=UPI000F735966|nr:hypothetical protein [Acinetobacter pittii]RSN94550.1 hypothetical protein EA765_19300 [Acinetobacter pittii]